METSTQEQVESESPNKLNPANIIEDNKIEELDIEERNNVKSNRHKICEKAKLKIFITKYFINIPIKGT